MDLYLQGKCAVVTGASRGLGRAIALALAREGVGLAICARGNAALDATTRELRGLGVPVHAAACDVGDGDALHRFLCDSHASLGRMDVLVNNASGFGMGDDDESWQAGWSVDVMASVRAARQVVPWMKDAGGGSIVHISSICALEASGLAAYSAAKAALISHARSMATSLAPAGVRVNVVAPGAIQFPGGYWDRLQASDSARYKAVRDTIPFQRLGAADEVADAVVFLASPRASWISGTTLIVDGGQHKGAGLVA